mmetsp:Transcript_100938/g.324013  ORF Transcript_100938/g.324013 Transcript_100938/m.324013 type:complete len:251 (-) Transcript_100938:338-1090(-)
MLRPDVPVAEVERMQVAYCCENLSHQLHRLALGKVGVFENGLQQLASCAQLRHELIIQLILEHVVKPDDVRMVHDLHELCHGLEMLGFTVFLVHALQAIHLLARFVGGLAQNAEAALRDLDVVHSVKVVDLVHEHGGRPAGLDGDLHQELLLQLLHEVFGVAGDPVHVDDPVSHGDAPRSAFGIELREVAILLDVLDHERFPVRAVYLNTQLPLSACLVYLDDECAVDALGASPVHHQAGLFEDIVPADL